MSSIYLLPVVVCLWFPLTFLTTYLIAVLSNHVPPIFPYISDTGTFSPESCIFGQLLNMGALLFYRNGGSNTNILLAPVGVVIYIRYRHAREIISSRNLPTKVQKLNKSSFIIGIIATIGVDVVANFQETNVFSIHITSANIGFGCGTIYMLMQTVLSYKLYPWCGKIWINYTRLFLFLICAVAFLSCQIFGGLAFTYFRDNPIVMVSGKTMENMAKWKKGDGGWEYHIASTISEWVTMLAIMTFILTFSSEFKKISFGEPVIIVNEYNDGSSTMDARA